MFALRIGLIVFITIVHINLIQVGATNLMEFNAAREQCFKEVSVTKEDLIKSWQSKEEVPENVFCGLKCLWERIGMLRSDGTVNLETFRNLTIFKLNPERKAFMLKCLEDIDIIIECNDMRKAKDCLANMMQISNTDSE